MRFEKVVKLYLTFIVLMNIYLIIMGIQSVGLGWDSQIDSIAALEFEQVRNYTNLQEAYLNIFYTSEFYGNFIQYTANKLYSIYTFTETTIDPNSIITYRWQIILNIFIFIFSGIILSTSTSIIFKTKKYVIYTFAVFLTFPVLFGMSLVNFKDTPVMSGITLISCSFIYLLSEKKLNYLIFSILFTLGLIFALGTRIGIFYILSVIIFCNIISVIIFFIKFNSKLKIFYIFSSVIISFIFAFLILRIINPLIRIDVFQLIIDSYSITSNNPLIIDIKIAGINVNSTEIPLWYVPTWLLVKLPLIQILILVTFLIYFLTKSTINLNFKKFAYIFPFIIQSLIIPLLIIIYRPVMYDEIRHILFIYPGLIFFNSLIFYLIINDFKKKKSFFNVTLLSLLIIYPLSNLFNIYKWFPYSYAYVNEIGKLTGREKSWDIDYWGVSSYEGVKKLKKYKLNSIVVSPTISTSFFLGVKKPQDMNAFEKSNYGFYKFYRFDNFQFNPYCKQVFVISRDSFNLGAGAICFDYND